MPLRHTWKQRRSDYMKFEIDFKTIESVAGPLVVVGKQGNAKYNEIVRVRLHDGEQRLGQVLRRLPY